MNQRSFREITAKSYGFGQNAFALMVPIRPELVPANSVSADDALGVISFGRSLAGASVTIPIRQLGPDPVAEIWRSSMPVERGVCDGIAYGSNGAVLFGSISGSGPETDATTQQLYRKIVETARRAGYPHLLRVWNHVGGINEDERELERYKRFSAGRHEALTGLGYAREQFPAACAVGMNTAGIIVYFIASRSAGLQVENPRQVAAYDYPPKYGPRSPSFSRATVVGWDGTPMIFVSGTSSVVGHRTCHVGDVQGQLDETLRNIEKIVCESASRAGGHGSLENLGIVKTYLRRASDYDLVAGRVKAALPRAQHLFLESDICRPDLLIEIEGVARL
jgi:chorismate lyase / 3-hydroxybenzoate synthase